MTIQLHVMLHSKVKELFMKLLILALKLHIQLEEQFILLLIIKLDSQLIQRK